MHTQHLEENKKAICQVTLDLFNCKANLDASEIKEMVFTLMNGRGCFTSGRDDIDALDSFIDDCNNVHTCKSLTRVETRYEHAFYDREVYPDSELIPLENQKYL